MTTPWPSPVPQADVDAAELIRREAESGYSRFRDRADLSTIGIRSAIAKVYTTAEQKMDALEERSKSLSEATRQKLTAAAWGIDDIAGSNPVDRAAAAMSYRDALDRAAKLASEQDALAALKQAEDIGDELAARAIAKSCYDRGMLSVVDTYIENRPAAGKALVELLRTAQTKVSITDLWAFQLTKPAEIASLQDYEIAALAGA